jgi:hypothetical protein
MTSAFQALPRRSFESAGFQPRLPRRAKTAVCQNAYLGNLGKVDAAVLVNFQKISEIYSTFSEIYNKFSENYFRNLQ